MRKGERTREWIVARAAEVFNTQGAAGASLSDIMHATGLKKGGIYNHFGSKDELALASFDHAAALVERRFAPVWRETGIAALTAFVETFRGYGESPPLAGGCPILNTAVDSDDTHPALRDRARVVVDGWQRRLSAAVVAGQERREIRAEVDGASLATVVIATMEGGLMLSKLTGDLAHLERAAEHLLDHIEREIRAG
jgi:TetR/AcrR family transcriptional regulator, transcriptional repressor for nem operon